MLPARAPSPPLDRRLGPLDSAGIVISNVIGSGIFIVPTFIALMVPNPWAVLGLWLFGGLLAFAGAMAYAELATLRPHAGGEYVYLREAFGPLAAFMTGWTSFVAGFSGAIAASAVGLASYMGRFIPAAGDTTPIVSLPLGFITLSLSPQSAVALTAIVALSVVHIVGLGPGRVVQNFLAGLKVIALMAFIAFGFTLGRGSFAHLSGGDDVAATSWLLALVMVMFSYSGWNAAAYVAEEVRDPSRNVPRALALGTGIVVAIYLGMNLLYLYAMPIGEIAAVKGRVVDSAAERLFGSSIGDLLALAAIIIVAASISAMVLAGPRVYFAMARDGLFFRAAGRVHSRFRTPVIAIAAQGLWSCLLVLSGTFSQLLSYTGFAVILFAGIAVSALFVLRRRLPLEDRPFRALGYPLAPAVFTVASAAIVINLLVTSFSDSVRGLVIMGLGLPIYAWIKSGFVAMWKGLVPLREGFWLWHVGGGLPLVFLIFATAGSPIALSIFAVLLIIYSTIVAVGLARSASRYQGSRVWVVLAVIFGVIPSGLRAVFVVVGILLGLFQRSG